MTVIKLKSGGLWVHTPIAPTKECLKLLKELDAPVEYIIFPTFAYEHKIFVGPFSRKFPKAKVYVAPNQWSWPISFPPQFFGIFPNGELKNMDEDAPWSDEISQKVFMPPEVGMSTNWVFMQLCPECCYFPSRQHSNISHTLIMDCNEILLDKIESLHSQWWAIGGLIIGIGDAGFQNVSVLQKANGVGLLFYAHHE